MSTARTIRDLLKTEIAKGGAIPDIAKRCARTLADDPVFCRAFVLDRVPELAEKAARRLAHERPSGIRQIGGALMTSDQITALIKQDNDRAWSRWIQQDARGNEIPLMEMTRVQLMQASERWIGMGAAAYKEAAFLRAIHGQLGDTDQVRDRFSFDELETLFADLSIETSVNPFLKSERRRAIS